MAGGAGGGPRVPAPGDGAPLTDDQAALREKILSGPRGAGAQAFALTDAAGALVGPFGVFLHAPAVGGALADLGERLRFSGSLDGRRREIAVLTVAVACGSGFEVYAHSRLARSAGLSGAEVDAVLAGRPCSTDPGEVLVQDAARRLVADEAPDEALADAVVSLGARLALELVALVGYYRTLAQLMAVFGVEAPEQDSGDPEHI